MTYKFQPRLDVEWALQRTDGSSVSMSELMRLLAAVEAEGHIAGACQVCGMSYRHAWGLLRRAEHELERPLLETSRRNGSRLTPFAEHLLWLERRVQARLAPVLQEVAADLQDEIARQYPENRPALRMHASHGFAVEGLMHAAEHSGLSVDLRYRTAVEALVSLSRDECDLAGFQVPDGEFEQAILQHYRPWLDASRHCLIYLARRETGLFLQPGNPRGIASLQDLARPEVRFVNRQVGSSTRLLLSLMLRKLNIDPASIRGYETSEFTHMAVAAHIVGGMADAGIGVQTAAWRCGLDFIPLATERYFFAVRRDSLATPPMRQFLALLLGPAYREFVGKLAGYDAAELGRVMSLDEAFGGAVAKQAA